MGKLRSTTDFTGIEVNGILLGMPNECACEPPYFSWDDSALPNGSMDSDGVLTLDVEETI